jgi:NAD(P)-dependent dehydrogenase (short-subunit alcohol dehydrogenase family)
MSCCSCKGKPGACSRSAGWTTADLPSQAGKLVVITGASGGLGFETALALARVGAEVVLAGRNEAKGQDALQRIKSQVADAQVRFELVDLASLASVAAFSARLIAQQHPIDVLINNAGVMALPTRQTTKDGFEMQFGVNYLSHFALTAQVLPLLRQAPQPRVVSLSSIAQHTGFLYFDDLQGERSYRPSRAYGQSKLAMLMFALELQRRSDAHGWGLSSIGAHPGWARTGLFANGPAINGRANLGWRLTYLLEPIFTHSAPEGALPILYAAASPDAMPGGYYGPNGFLELTGHPGPATVTRRARNKEAAARLWEISEKMIG